MKLSLPDRFWSKVKKNKNGCWLWNAYIVGGYGRIRVGKNGGYLAHRLSWEIHFGEIPKQDDELCVLHKCDIGHCVNPDHLFLGTRTENNADRHNKGRTAKGKKLQCYRKLTKLDIDEIKILRNDFGWTLRKLGEKFNVSAQAILYRLRMITNNG